MCPVYLLTLKKFGFYLHTTLNAYSSSKKSLLFSIPIIISIHLSIFDYKLRILASNLSPSYDKLSNF